LPAYRSTVGHDKCAGSRKHRFYWCFRVRRCSIFHRVTVTSAKSRSQRLRAGKSRAVYKFDNPDDSNSIFYPCRTCRTSSPAQVRQVGQSVCRTTTPLGVWGGARQQIVGIIRSGKIMRFNPARSYWHREYVPP
jgi:hypothetical protein